MCQTCRLWVKTPEALSEHFKGRKHKKHCDDFAQKLTSDRREEVVKENNALPQMSQREKDHLTVVALIFEYGSECHQYYGDDEFYRLLLGLLTAPMREYALAHIDSVETDDVFVGVDRAACLVGLMWSKFFQQGTTRNAGLSITDIMRHPVFQASPHEVSQVIYGATLPDSDGPQFVGPVAASDSTSSWHHVPTHPGSLSSGGRNSSAIAAAQIANISDGRPVDQPRGPPGMDAVYAQDPWAMQPRELHAAFPFDGQAVAAPLMGNAANAPPSSAAA